MTNNINNTNNTTRRVNVTFNDEMITSLNKLKKYDDEYSIDLDNILDVINNQTTLIYANVEKIGLDQKQRQKVLKPLWQIESLLDVVRSKVDRDFFVQLTDFVYNIDYEIKEKA